MTLSSPLISTDQLSDLLATRKKVLIFDCTYDLDAPEVALEKYKQQHIPDAHYLDLDSDLSGPLLGHNGRHPLPEAEKFLSLLATFGATASTHFVVYDANNGAMAAARAWWMLSEWLGLQNVQLLDGGLSAWMTRGFEVSNQIPQRHHLKSMSIHPQLLTVNTQQILENLEDAKYLVIDARSPERFMGRDERRARVGGHIPNAVNHWYGNNLTSQGFFKSEDELYLDWSARLSDLEPQNVIMQCGSGVTACHNLLAMKIAGFCGVKLYPGSWSEWAHDASRPVATN